MSGASVRVDAVHRPTPGLAAGDVHVWSASLETLPHDEATLAATLSSEETARAQAFVFAADRRRFLASRFLLRHLLGRYLARHPRTLRFTSTTFGKPRIKGADSLDFNVSHSGDVALIIFGRARQVGIDVERLRTDVDVAALAMRYFTTAEALAIAQTPPAEQAARFVTLWVRKEAILKASGYGLRAPLDAVDVARSEHNRPVVMRLPDGVSQWLCVDLQAPPGYRAAAAVDQPPRRFCTRDLTPATLDAIADWGRST
jgi:4'-phosphopantetheinyl transferase